MLGIAEGNASIVASSNNLSAGTYTVTITDQKNCTASTTVNIVNPPAIQLQYNSVAATCGQANGSATVIANGGTGALSYVWSPNVSTTSNANSLLASAYTVTVTDANNCTNSISVNINNNGGPAAQIKATTDVTCFGGNNGSAGAAISGGTSPYT